MFIELNMAYMVAFLFFLTAAGYIYTAVFSIINDPKSKLRRECFTAVLFIVSACLFYGLMTIAENETLRRVFWGIAFVSYLLFLPLWIRFSSNMIEIRSTIIKHILRWGLIAVTAVVSLLCLLSREVSFVLTPLGNQFTYYGSSTFVMLSIYVFIISVIVFIVHIRWWRESKIKREEQQQYWFVVLTFLFAPLGFSTDFVIPVFTNITVTPLVSVLLFPASLRLFLSMRTNRTLSITAPNVTNFIFKSVSTPTLVLDRNNYICLANDAALNYLGDDIVGINILEFDFTDEEKALFSNENFDGKTAKIHAITGVRTCDISLTVEKDKYGDTLCKIVMLKDITKREYKSNLQKLVNSIAALLLNTDIVVFEDKLTQCAQAIDNVVGLDGLSIWRSLSDGLHATQMYYWDKETGGSSIPEEGLDYIDIKKDMPQTAELFEKGESFNGPVSLLIEEELLKMFGLVSMFAVPIFINNKFWGAVLFEDKKRERYFDETCMGMMHSVALLLANSAIRNEMVENLRSTTEASVKAEFASKTKSSFLANMSHEIRTPMNTIIGITEILMQEEKLPEKIEDGLDKIFAASNLLLGIINDILDFSKIEAGKLEVLEYKYEVASLITDSVHLNVMKIESKPIEFELQIDENIPCCLIGDELRIKQILNNLLSNAFKYTDAGKVVLAISCNKAKDNVVILKLDVNDTGHGMTPEQVEKLYEEYSRFGDDSATEGAGLGLSITQRLVALMNGVISVDSEPGKGSSFRVLLPQTVADECVLGKELAENLQFFKVSQKGRNRRKVTRNPMPYGSVLVVDDVVTNIHVAVGLMKLYKLQIDTASSGFEAIEKIESGKSYDIVFMDHMMPKMNGIETVKRLRGLGYAKPIVALTANAVVGQSEIFLQNGFDSFISKPIDVRQLDAILNKYIRDKQPAEPIDTAVKKIIGDDCDTAAQKIATRMLSTKIDGLNLFGGLERCEGDSVLYLKVLRSFTENIPDMLDSMKTVDKTTLADYEVTVHGIKGASFDISAEDVGKDAKALEFAAKDANLDYIIANNEAFHVKARKLISDIESMISTIDTENPKPKKDKPESALLSKLHAACRDFSVDAADAAMSEIEKYQYTADDGLVSFLRERIDMMDFEQIAEKLSGYEP